MRGESIVEAVSAHLKGVSVKNELDRTVYSSDDW